MSSSVKGKIINRDSNKQLYRSNKSYEEQMRQPTERDAAILDKFRKESEFVKPYASDSYEDMEYGFIPPPDFGGWNDLTFPDVKWAKPILEFGDLSLPDDDPIEKCHIVLWCLQDVCYCPGSEKCFLMKCSHRVVSMRIRKFIGSGLPAGFSITKGAGNEICITAPVGATETMAIDYLLEYVCDGKKFYAWVESQAWVSACAESECCDDSGLAWDDPTSADTVDRSASVTVAILDPSLKGKPYSWAVSGTGFTLTNAITTGLTNTLSADGTACGSATITVTGCDGTVVTGYVRCTTGRWVFVSESDTSCYDSLNCEGSCGNWSLFGKTCAVTTGKFQYNYVSKSWNCGLITPCSCSCNMGSPPCYTYAHTPGYTYCEAYYYNLYEWTC